MPRQSHSGIHGVPWHRCDRCGYDYPVDKLTLQHGRILCTVKCVDDTTNENREAVIAQVLASNEEEPKLAEILKRDQAGDDDFGGGFTF